MVALELLTVLEARGVKLSIQAGQLTSRGPVGAITPDLGEQIKAQKAALLEALAPRSGDMLPPLPWETAPGLPERVTAELPQLPPDLLPDHLARLVSMAKAGKLPNGTAKLASGIAPDLSVYVLAWAECWPRDRAHVLRRLEEAHAVTVGV